MTAIVSTEDWRCETCRTQLPNLALASAHWLKNAGHSVRRSRVRPGAGTAPLARVLPAEGSHVDSPLPAAARPEGRPLRGAGAQAEVQSLGPYVPLWLQHQLGPATTTDALSDGILRLKNGDRASIRYFSKRLESLIEDGQVVACVPPSDPANARRQGIRAVAHQLCMAGDRIDGTEVLERHRAIEASHLGGVRTVAVHLDSVTLRRPEIIRDRSVVLLDDVVTTGSSMRACSSILLDGGAAAVQCVAIGRTAMIGQLGRTQRNVQR